MDYQWKPTERKLRPSRRDLMVEEAREIDERHKELKAEYEAREAKRKTALAGQTEAR